MKRFKRLFTALTVLTVVSAGLFAVKSDRIPFGKSAAKAPQEQADSRKGKSELPAALRMVPSLHAGDVKRSARPAVRAYSQKPEPINRQITSAESGKIYGGAIYADDWTTTSQPVGIYAFEKNDGSTVAPVKIGDDYVVTGGGFFANGKYYFVSYMSFMGFVLADLYTVDFETWEIERDMPVDIGAVAQDMAYDPTTGNVYGCFMNDDGDAWIFGILDIESGKRTKLCDLDIIILSVGVNSKGEVYGVGLDGNFYRFDKLTGARTKIGSTGRTPVYSASGCFDLQTDTFYWECIEADSKAKLYTIDLKTGAATYVTSLANNMEMTGMFIPVPDAQDDAPAKISDLTLSFAEGARSGQIIFTMPDKTFNSDKTLTGEFNWHVTVNESQKFEGKARAGAQVKVDYSAASAGNIRVAAYTSNDAGNSPVASATAWLGNDAPAMVKNIRVERGDNAGDFTVSWDAPDGTAHGGYVDPARVRYDVVRMPENVKVASAISATSTSESFDESADFVLHTYVVTPIFEDERGESAESRQFGTGSLSLPFFTPFGDESDFAYFSVEDSNGDGVTWEYDPISEAARIKYSFALSDDGYTTPDMDDWLFSPALRLQAGHMIKVSVDSRVYSGAYGSSYTERFEVKLGKSPVSSQMESQVIPVTNVTNSDLKTYTGYTSVPEDGIYYLGVHGCSPKDQLYLYIDNYTVEVGPVLGTPGDITELKATAGANGALQATLSFKAPTKTVDGAELTNIDKIEIRRNGALIHTIENPAPGAALTYTDMEAGQGDNSYTLMAYNSKGKGYEASVSVYVGYDRPGLPLNVKATEQNGNVVLTWQAPFEGESGGYHDPNALTYTILRANDEKELAVGIKGLTYTDVNPPLNGLNHEFFTYYVYAQSPAGYGYGVASNSVCIGKPFEIPFAESFAAGRQSCGPWDVYLPEESYGWWQIVAQGQYPTAFPQDNDGGMVTFIPEEEGDSGKLISGKISMKNVDYPTLDFWYYCYPGTSDKVNVYVNPDNKGEKLMEGVSIGSGQREGWIKKSIDLSAYANAENIQIIFNAISGDAYNNIHLDNISVRETYDNNLAATALSVPSRMMATEKSTVTATISNLGLNSITDYTVELYRDGKLEQTKTPGRLTSGSILNVDFEVVPTAVWGSKAILQAKVVCAIDENADDDASKEVEAVITDLNFPAVDDLNASRDGNDVNLEWNEPNFVSGQAQTVVEDVEGIKAFSIANLGDWSVIDGDGKFTYGINDGGSGSMLMYDNAGQPMAFMAFNPTKAGVPVEYSDGTPTDWAPHSGDQYFASFAVDGKNDDWLISPMLPGIEQQISFWVRSVTGEYGFEKYEVYYSTTGIDRDDFKIIGDTRTAPVAWVEEKVTLPEGTRYFAIRCVSEDCYVFMLDDIKFQTANTYMGELSMMGYNVYRDLELLTKSPIMEQTYTDAGVGAGAHVYNVTVVYDLGESRLSNTAAVEEAGVASVNPDGVTVEAGVGFLRVTAPEGMEVYIFTAGGLQTTSFISSGSRMVNLPSGVYLITVKGAGTVKAVVR